MSTLVNHKLIGTSRLTPSLVRSSHGIDSDAAYTITTTTQAAAGNLILIYLMGVQSRIPTDITGFTTEFYSPSGGGTAYWYWKISDGTEGTSWNVSTVSSLQGGWVYMEFTDIDASIPFGLDNHSTSGGISVLNFTPPAFSIVLSSLVLSHVVLHATSNTWQCGNSFTAITPVSSSYYLKMAYRKYGDVIASDTSPWTSSNGRLVFGGYQIINGKPVF